MSSYRQSNTTFDTGPEFLLTEGTTDDDLNDAKFPIILCDGRANAAALSETSVYGLRQVMGPRFLAVGLIDGWESWSGWLGNEIWPPPKKFAWKDEHDGTQRRVTLAFDRHHKNEHIRLIAGRLREAGARVSIFAWPINLDVNTVCELVNTFGHAVFLKVLEVLTAGSANVAFLAAAIKVGEHFARDPGGLLHRFERGVYIPRGRQFVRLRIKQVLEAWELAPRWKNKLAREVEGFLAADAPELWPTPPRDVINVLNGLLDPYTRQLRPHSPDHLTSVQLPVAFDPAAQCPAWDWFCQSVFPADCLQLPFHLVAWFMTADMSIQRAVLLLGEGANGKSTFLAAFLAFLGPRNCSTLSLQKISNDRFAAARLVGKVANIAPDIPATHLIDTSVFKSIVGGDVINAERKYVDSFEFQPFVKLIFSANTPPHSNDSSHGFFRRWLVVPFTKTFDEGAATTYRRTELDEMLSKPEELSGVLKRALDVLPEIQNGTIPESASMRAAWEQFRNETDPLAVWLDKTVVDNPNGMVGRQELLDLYNADCEAHRRPIAMASSFGLALKRLKPNIKDAQRTYAQKPRTHVYLGIKYANSGRVVFTR